MMSKEKGLPKQVSSRSEVDAFLRQVETTQPRSANELKMRGRLIFGMDATASRQPIWDRAASIQAEMFEVTADLGSLDVQLAFYRGFQEFKVSQWTSQPKELSRLMTSVSCLAGTTQLGKMLKHARNQALRQKINALVFVGDAFEEDVDDVGCVAGELGILGLPIFMFHEGDCPLAGFAFQQIAKLSGGGYCRFDGTSGNILRRLLNAVAVYAVGGRMALEDMAAKQGGETRQLMHQLRLGN